MFVWANGNPGARRFSLGRRSGLNWQGSDADRDIVGSDLYLILPNRGGSKQKGFVSISTEMARQHTF